MNETDYRLLDSQLHALLDKEIDKKTIYTIVTKPIEGTGKYAPEVARAYVTALRELLRGLGVSDVKMEQGSLRCDVNVSLNRPGEQWGTRSETKNVNSLRSVERAVRSEVERQAARLQQKLDELFKGTDQPEGDVYLMRG